MENKKKTYLLLAIAILVWGLIAYKIFKAVNPDVPVQQSNLQVSDFKPYKIAKKEGFNIKADYRDPFLGTFNQYKQKKRKTSTSKPKKEEPKKKVVFPSIVYKGIISPHTHNQRFIIKITGNTYLYKLSETHKNIQLLSGDDKKIVVQYKGEQKSIPLK